MQRKRADSECMQKQACAQQREPVGGGARGRMQFVCWRAWTRTFLKLVARACEAKCKCLCGMLSALHGLLMCYIFGHIGLI